MAQIQGRQAKLTDYDGFVEKFKPQKTTDDCYTPKVYYDCILDWIKANVNPLEGVEIVRPFWPGGDYESHHYPPNCAVIDNPPFSILAKIVRYYQARGIKFWLFTPSLTLTGLLRIPNVTAVVAGESLVYENKAEVATSFVTNLYPSKPMIVCAGSLTKELIKATDIIKAQTTKPQKKIIYPDCVTSTALLGKISKRGIDFTIEKGEGCFIDKLDNYKGEIFGGASCWERAEPPSSQKPKEPLPKEPLPKEPLPKEPNCRIEKNSLETI